MSLPLSTSTPKVRQNFIDGCAKAFQTLGLPRTTGQVYGLIFLSDRRYSLDDLVASLQMSKGSASIATRALLELQAIREIVVPGERRPFFEAVEDLSFLTRRIFERLFKTRISAVGESLNQLLDELEDDAKKRLISTKDAEFCRMRLNSLAESQKRLHKIATLVEKQVT